MRHLFQIVAFLFLLNSNAQELSLMSYNIKLDYPKEGENSWENRKPFFIGQLKFYSPDILGVQEAMPNQMKDMDSLLNDYSFVGVGRDDGKDSGEYSAIFYNKTKFKVIKSSTFWLSETPDKVSMGWDAVCNRVCTYALFENIKNKERFWVFNTHFDHVGVTARANSTCLILSKIKEFANGKLPVFLMGDFNLEPETENIQLIKATLEDSKDVSQMQPFGPSGTFNGFKFDEAVTRRIDYIFVSKKNIKVNKYAVLSDNENLKYPSDHLPVYIEAQLNTN
ncbi:endonuclease/exonuclease/phosphatase family protein [Subsaxibacter sp. CAU 1640]|uniref:endonuclease/exonuclease/phosphatase family protein n=1 Tax=Subsaxibacter sp. CAU 1640 TaxID=2933271 RepID=UPI002004FBB9|nr:endonuclease/exonuclease/phosphatase family protein [Subsaxibacter sp. CAU 1640]MCK7590672.1 endonuclease/exonuclease/phosphatase family protein [Subsaxibacter sp. CAU 1640]